MRSLTQSGHRNATSIFEFWQKADFDLESELDQRVRLPQHELLRLGHLLEDQDRECGLSLHPSVLLHQLEVSPEGRHDASPDERTVHDLDHAEFIN